jgi:farnesyl diphosphate synthase
VCAAYQQIGTDIQDNKCGWLIVQALDRATDAQKAVLKVRTSNGIAVFLRCGDYILARASCCAQEHYGRHEDDSVATVKALYKDMGLEQVFRDYEDASYASLRKRISAASASPAAVYEALLAKIYKRSM